MTKVFQWASGTVGRHAARVTAKRSELELIGLHVRSAEKVGRDIGEAGKQPTGATTVLRAIPLPGDFTFPTHHHDGGFTVASRPAD